MRNLILAIAVASASAAKITTKSGDMLGTVQTSKPYIHCYGIATLLCFHVFSFWFSPSFFPVQMEPGKSFSVQCPGDGNDAYATGRERGKGEAQAICDETVKEATEKVSNLSEYASSFLLFSPKHIYLISTSPFLFSLFSVVHLCERRHQRQQQPLSKQTLQTSLLPHLSKRRKN